MAFKDQIYQVYNVHFIYIWASYMISLTLCLLFKVSSILSSFAFAYDSIKYGSWLLMYAHSLLVCLDYICSSLSMVSSCINQSNILSVSPVFAPVQSVTFISQWHSSYCCMLWIYWIKPEFPGSSMRMYKIFWCSLEYSINKNMLSLKSQTSNLTS